jgi:hypothetical protein
MACTESGSKGFVKCLGSPGQKRELRQPPLWGPYSPPPCELQRWCWWQREPPVAPLAQDARARGPAPSGRPQLPVRAGKLVLEHGASPLVAGELAHRAESALQARSPCSVHKVEEEGEKMIRNSFSRPDANSVIHVNSTPRYTEAAG